MSQIPEAEFKGKPVSSIRLADGRTISVNDTHPHRDQFTAVKIQVNEFGFISIIYSCSVMKAGKKSITHSIKRCFPVNYVDCWYDNR